jgi:hypothetical protein
LFAPPKQAHYAAAVAFWWSSFVFLLATAAVRRCAWGDSESSTTIRRREGPTDSSGGVGGDVELGRSGVPPAEAEARRQRPSGALPPPWDCGGRCLRARWQSLGERLLDGAAGAGAVALALRWRARGLPGGEGDERVHLGWQGLAQQVCFLV